MYMDYTDIANAISAATGDQLIKPSGVLAKINQALQPSLNEMFFTTRLALVEGLEDVAYITSYLNLLGKWDEYRRVGCHVVPVNGKSEMLKPLVIAKHMRIPTFIIFDSDKDKQNQDRRLKHEKDNKALLALIGKTGENPMPTNSLWGKGFVMWHSNIGAIVSQEIGTTEWSSYQTEADRQYGHAGNLRKNSLHIGASLALAWNAGKRSSSLERVCNEILDLASSIQ
jgi:hypothetical protein